MVVVRLARGGAKKHPFYHIVVTDSRRRRDSGYLERLGYFNPFAAKGDVPVFLNRDRFDYWLSQGAKSSQRVSSIVSKLDKGKFAIKEETKKVEADTEEAKESSKVEADAEEAKKSSKVEADAGEAKKSSKKSEAESSQEKLELEDTQEKTPEEKKTISSKEAESDAGNETPSEEPKVESSEPSEIEKAGDK